MKRVFTGFILFFIGSGGLIYFNKINDNVAFLFFLVIIAGMCFLASGAGQLMANDLRNKD
jgi:hypothetical protein